MNALRDLPAAVVFVLATVTWGGLTAARAEEAAQTPQTPAADRQIIRVTIRGTVYEGNPPLSLFAAETGPSLRELTDAIAKAAADPAAAGLVVQLRSTSLGRSQMHALRRALLEFRKSGKPSHCHVDYAGSREYLLASACSDVSMLPTGLLEIPGVGIERMYVKDLLGKLGIEIQELRMGRYKSAAEMLTRDGPSDAVREESQAILDDLFDDLIAAIAENRPLAPSVVRGLIDRAIFSAEEAKEVKLVDRVEYEDEFLERIQSDGERRREIVDARLGKKLELGAGGFAGMMALLNELFGGPKKAASSGAPKIALVHGGGAIVTGGGQESLFGGSMMTSAQMVKIFREVRDDETVKAVVFRVDSPGGSALASDLIWREVKLTAAKKPLVVSMADLAASGGYYVSCAATWIVAERGTLTGSIGVIGAVPDMTALCESIGVKFSALSRGKRAEIVSPYGRLTDDGRELLLATMRRIYDDFVAKVAEGRKLPREAVASIAEGRVWTGVRAQKLGLVDELGGLDAALAKARDIAGLPADCEIISLPRAKSLFEVLTEMDASVIAWRSLLRGLPAELRPLLSGAEWIGAAARERVFAAMPEVWTVR